jgi:hypothetical protein
MTAALRTVYYDMPQVLQVPSEFQHRTIEVIMLPIEETNNTTHDFKSWLQNMPDVDDEIFARSKDMNESRVWAI